MQPIGKQCGGKDTNRAHLVGFFHAAGWFAKWARGIGSYAESYTRGAIMRLGP